MILKSPGSILFDLGIIKIYYYGVIMALSILMGLFACKIFCKKFYTKQDFEITYNLALGSIISGLLGARIYYVILAHKYFFLNPSEIFAIQHGGMSIHGGILGGLLFAITYLYTKKLNILKYLDILSIGLVSGQILGRWGNFFNSEAFGLPTNLPLKLFIPVDKRPIEFLRFQYFHPTFLYESLLNCLLFFTLIFIFKKTKKVGYVFFSYIFSYSLIRFFIESIRIDSILYINSIPVAQIVSILGIIVSSIGIFIIKYKKGIK